MKTFVSKMFIMGMILFSTISSSVPAPTTKEIVCQDTQLIIQGILDYYFENNATFHEPYYWWEGGLAFNNMIENAYLCQNNTISNAGMFQMAARLGKFFNNPVYLKQADEVFTWLRNVGFVNLDGNQTTVYDGANLETDCKDITEKQWSYNFGMTLGGCAYMYNVTGSDYWFNATESLWNGTRTRFFNDDGIR